MSSEKSYLEEYSLKFTYTVVDWWKAYQEGEISLQRLKDLFTGACACLSIDQMNVCNELLLLRIMTNDIAGHKVPVHALITETET